MRFRLRPARIVGTDDGVAAVEFERTALGDDGSTVGTGEIEHIPAQMVLRSVGYRGVPIAGVPFDEARGTIPNEAGRVIRDGTPSPGEYVAGWIKRGPSGVIGTNRSDAAETVRSLFEDAAAGRLQPPTASLERVTELLAAHGVDVVPWDGWLAINDAEVALGRRSGRPRIKLDDREGLLAAARSLTAMPVGGRAREKLERRR